MYGISALDLGRRIERRELRIERREEGGLVDGPAIDRVRRRVLALVGGQRRVDRLAVDRRGGLGDGVGELRLVIAHDGRQRMPRRAVWGAPRRSAIVSPCRPAVSASDTIASMSAARPISS